MKLERLYKYGRINEHSEQVFSSSQLWFSPPGKLNDPFECRPWLTFDGSDTDVVETLARILKKRDPNLTYDTAIAEAVAIFLQGRHRDPGAWESLRRELLTMLGEIGLCCFSKVPDSILMWSHYGLNHEGYCLEFEATEETPVFGEAQPVLYSNNYPTVDFFKTPKEEQADLIFLTKFTHWSYEQEWRIVDFIRGSGLRGYPPDLLKSVIFGLRTSEQHKEDIREWVKRRGHPVRFLQAVQNSHKFAIELQEIH